MTRVQLVRMAACIATSWAVAHPLAAQTTDALWVFDGQWPSAWRVQAADAEARATYTGQALQVPKAAHHPQPASRVALRPDARTPGQADALRLQFSDTWYAALRFEAPAPLDLGRFLAQGQLLLDLNVAEMAEGGLHIGLSCGLDCGRRVNQVRASRALAGRGWQTLAFPLQCFVRSGDDWAGATPVVTVDGSQRGEVAVARVRLSPQPVPGVQAQTCVAADLLSTTPEPLEQAWSIAWWHDRHRQKLAEARQLLAGGRSPQVVALGDSITQGWEDTGRAHWDRHIAPWGALNLGFGGDKTENLLWRLQHGALDGLRPQLLTLLIGTNNTGDRMDTAQATAAGVASVLHELRQRQPQAQVLLMALLPRDARADGAMRRRNADVNARIAALADGRQVHWLDLGPVLTEPDGTLSPALLPDGLHLSEAGYARWAQALQPALQRLVRP